MSDLRAGIRKPNIWMSLVHVTFVIREYAVLAFLFCFITFTFLLIFALVSLPLPLVITLDHAQRQASLAKKSAMGEMDRSVQVAAARAVAMRGRAK